MLSKATEFAKHLKTHLVNPWMKAGWNVPILFLTEVFSNLHWESAADLDNSFIGFKMLSSSIMFTYVCSEAETLTQLLWILSGEIQIMTSNGFEEV